MPIQSIQIYFVFLGLCQLGSFDLLAGWMGDFGKSRSALVWGAVPHCVLWVLWREQNNRIFEGHEVTSLELKSRVLRTLFEWMSTFTNLGLSSFEEFLDLCTLS